MSASAREDKRRALKFSALLDWQVKCLANPEEYVAARDAAGIAFVDGATEHGQFNLVLFLVAV